MDRYARIAEKVADMTVTEAPGLNAALADFVSHCQKMLDDYMASNFPNNPRKSLEWTVGGRWVRIVSKDVSSRSAWAFVDRTNGDVMKPASWSVPAKHPRANVFDKASWRNVGPYGPAYLR